MNLIAYYRVTTKRQARRGLDLAAQKAAVAAYVTTSGARIQATYTELERGKPTARARLAAAIAHAQRCKARLAMASLGRLTRDVALLRALRDSGCDFVASDSPNINKGTVRILAAVAEDEARCVSARTKTALAAAKAHGTVLGSARPRHWQGHEKARREGARRGNQVSVAVRRAKAMAAVADLLPAMRRARSKGASLAAIAERLNSKGRTTSGGSTWTPIAVKRVLDRAEGRK